MLPTFKVSGLGFGANIGYSTIIGLACLEALELLSISATNSLGSEESRPEETQQIMDSISDKFTQVCDSDEGECNAGADSVSIGQVLLPLLSNC